MSYDSPVTCVCYTVELEIPGELSDELQDAIADDLTYEGHLERLRLLIKRWARQISGENCHVSIDVE